VKIIFSRKGFDSTSGGKPSPILPDGRMVSLPIPDKNSPICYSEISWQEFNLGNLVSSLTKGKIPSTYRAHLDPDLRSDSLPRLPEWKPIFGQTGSAQGHLRNNGVSVGDIFLFFGLFRHVISGPDKIEWNTESPQRHVFWGWLQIDEVLKVDDCDHSRYKWAEYHPHFYRTNNSNNTLYVAQKHLTLPGLEMEEMAGAGVFPCYSDKLQLTAPFAATPSHWKLPQWFYPRNGKPPITYHANLTRWQRTDFGTILNAVTRGQEFILDCEEYPEAIVWLHEILNGN
jgi:Nucleotide modification associated domain 3